MTIWNEEVIDLVERIQAEGFFTRFQSEVMADDANAEGHVQITGLGNLPDEPRPEWNLLKIDAVQTIGKLYHDLETERRRVSKVTAKGDLGEWPEFDNTGDKVIGNLGRIFSFDIKIRFESKAA